MAARLLPKMQTDRQPAGHSKFTDLNLHEVKVGLRYEIW